MILALKDYLEISGLTDEAIARKLAEGADAMETKFFRGSNDAVGEDGAMIIEERDVIAWNTRLDYLKVALQIKGYLTKYQMELHGKDGGPAMVIISNGALPDPIQASNEQPEEPGA